MVVAGVKTMLCENIISAPLFKLCRKISSYRETEVAEAGFDQKNQTNQVGQQDGALCRFVDTGSICGFCSEVNKSVTLAISAPESGLNPSLFENESKTVSKSWLRVEFSSSTPSRVLILALAVHRFKSSSMGGQMGILGFG